MPVGLRAIALARVVRFPAGLRAVARLYFKPLIKHITKAFYVRTWWFETNRFISNHQVRTRAHNPCLLRRARLAACAKALPLSVELGAGNGGLAIGDAAVVAGKVAGREDGESGVLEFGGDALEEQAVHEHAAGKRCGAHAG